MLISFAGKERKASPNPKLIMMSLRGQNASLRKELNKLRAEYQIALSDLRGARNEIKQFEMKFRSLGHALDVARQCFPNKHECAFSGFDIDDIIIMTAKHFSLSLDDIKGNSRSRNIMIPRLIAAFLARTLTQQGNALIGMKLGGRDHSTILSAVNRIRRLRQVDAQVDYAIKLIIHELETRFGPDAAYSPASAGSAPAASPSPDSPAGVEPLSIGTT